MLDIIAKHAIFLRRQADAVALLAFGQLLGDGEQLIPVFRWLDTSLFKEVGAVEEDLRVIAPGQAIELAIPRGDILEQRLRPVAEVNAVLFNGRLQGGQPAGRAIDGGLEVIAVEGIGALVARGKTGGHQLLPLQIIRWRHFVVDRIARLLLELVDDALKRVVGICPINDVERPAPFLGRCGRFPAAGGWRRWSRCTRRQGNDGRTGAHHAQ